MVIFGAAGDLTRRLLISALYNLAASGLLPADFRLIGVARTDLSTDAFRVELQQNIEQFATGDVDDKIWAGLLANIEYLRGNFDDAATFKRLQKLLGKAGNVLFYLATGADYFAPIVHSLAQIELTRETPKAWRRVIVEKPFGHDLASAQALNTELLTVLEEKQIYRMDHYLGKETVQNIMVFRFANGIFEPLWNRDHIDHVQITVAETVGVESRGDFYDKTGALRDMVPNHMFQILSFIGMEVPTSFDADALRSEKVKILDSVRPLTAEQVLHDTVRGQYGPGSNGAGPNAAVSNGAGPGVVVGYREEPKVKANSETETYVAMKLLIDNWRWAGVPFYLRTGKHLPRRMSEVAIQFKCAPIAVFRDTAVDEVPPNLLVLRLQPDEGISLQFGAKLPGPELEIGGVKMNFQYKDYFQAAPSTGYETLIFDCIIGDQTLFQRADNVEAGWRVVQPLLDAWAERKPRGFPDYEAGSQGPRAADELLARDGRVWRKL